MEALLFTQGLNVIYEALILAILVLGLAVVMGLLNVLNIATARPRTRIARIKAS